MGRMLAAGKSFSRLNSSTQAVMSETLQVILPNFYHNLGVSRQGPLVVANPWKQGPSLATVSIS